MIQVISDDPSPNAVVQKILLEYIKDFSESIGKDLVSWDEYEARYETNELKWISDFVINNLVFIE